MLNSRTSNPDPASDDLHTLDGDQIEVLERRNVGVLPEHLHVESAARPGRHGQETSRDEHAVGLGEQPRDIALVLEAIEDGDNFALRVASCVRSAWVVTSGPLSDRYGGKGFTHASGPSPRRWSCSSTIGFRGPTWTIHPEPGTWPARLSSWSARGKATSRIRPSMPRRYSGSQRNWAAGDSCRYQSY